jgi:predicted alpha/beta-fold hydrolase
MRRDGSRSTAPGVHAAAFRPAQNLGNRHLQTIWAVLFRKPPALPLLRERWELPDGDFVDVDRFAGHANSPRLLVLHGLEGSSESNYARGLLSQAHARGWGGVGLNFRSCSGEPNRLPRMYHSGETTDLSLVVKRLCAEAPDRTLFIAGVSLGGNVLVKWLGEQGEAIAPQVRGAAAISVPFDLTLCAQSLDGKGFWARIYRKRFLSTLMKKARAKLQAFPGAVARDLEDVEMLADFDDRFTGPLHGFRDASDYYTRSSSGPYVPRVRVPLLLISAEDDPFIPAEAMPREAIAKSDFVRLEVSRTGGHVGFIEGSGASPSYWAEARVGEFFEALA